MKYTNLFFDIDNTLLDFDASEKKSLQKVYNNMNMDFDDADLSHYRNINESMWRSYERGEMTIEEIFDTRFTKVFKAYGKDVDGILVERIYREYLNNRHDVIDGAEELLGTLSKKYSIYAVTNGLAETQYQRLKDSGLHKYFSGIFPSSEVGHKKPDIEYFQYVFSKIENFEPKSGLVIGDNLLSDIYGGINAGLDTCWYNIRGVEKDTEIIPNYEIKQLEELYEILD